MSTAVSSACRASSHTSWTAPVPGQSTVRVLSPVLAATNLIQPTSSVRCVGKANVTECDPAWRTYRRSKRPRPTENQHVLFFSFHFCFHFFSLFNNLKKI
uniref:Proprotein convertase subtilisin n=1 Tax=Branchiostoma belcheri tsingtauense TaxID=155462 RepID=Q6ITV6_BRABE|nr:proprotein convertase subtilisin [Branchiostoma belcheri tsingtauense]